MGNMPEPSGLNVASTGGVTEAVTGVPGTVTGAAATATEHAGAVDGHAWNRNSRTIEVRLKWKKY